MMNWRVARHRPRLVSVILAGLFLTVIGVLTVGPAAVPETAFAKDKPKSQQSARQSKPAPYVVLGYNELGMHCMNEDFSEICILPPFNTLLRRCCSGARSPGSSHRVSACSTACPATRSPRTRPTSGTMPRNCSASHCRTTSASRETVWRAP